MWRAKTIIIYFLRKIMNIHFKRKLKTKTSEIKNGAT